MKHVHPVVQNLFLPEQRSDLPAAATLKHFHENWRKLTSDPQILEGYQILISGGLSNLIFIRTKADQISQLSFLTKKEESLLDLEIQVM